MTTQKSPIASVVVLEDEHHFRRFLSHVLEGEFELLFVDTSEQMFEQIAQRQVDLILLDILLPGEDGIEVAKILRTRTPIPVILLSALSSNEMIATGLNVGADDYVTKPFDTDVLRARMRNAIRRNKATPAGAVQISFIPVGDCQIDPWTRNISHPGGATERLTEMEIQLLTALLQTPDCVTDRDNLSRLISGQEWSPNNRSLDVHISHLRKKLERLTNMKNTIVSFRGIGYALQLEAFKQVTE